MCDPRQLLFTQQSVHCGLWLKPFKIFDYPCYCVINIQYRISVHLSDNCPSGTLGNNFYLHTTWILSESRNADNTPQSTSMQITSNVIPLILVKWLKISKFQNSIFISSKNNNFSVFHEVEKNVLKKSRWFTLLATTYIIMHSKLFLKYIILYSISYTQLLLTLCLTTLKVGHQNMNILKSAYKHSSMKSSVNILKL